MWTARILSIAFCVGLVSCADNRSEISVRIANNLTTILHPVQDDPQGFLDALEICDCVSSELEKSWEEDRLVLFDKELAEHANSYNQVFFEAETILIDNLGDYELPRLSQHMSSELESMHDLIANCEDQVGGPGIEY